MQPLAEASAASSVRENSRFSSSGLPVSLPASHSGIIGDAEIFPRHQRGADIPGHGGGDQKRDHAGHGAVGQRAGRRAHFLGGLRGAFDAEIIPDAELEGGDDADPAIGQGVAGRDQFIELQHRALRPRADREEQDDDRDIGDRGDDEVDVERHQHAAIVQPCQHDDGGGDEGIVGEPFDAGLGDDRCRRAGWRPRPPASCRQRPGTARR